MYKFLFAVVISCLSITAYSSDPDYSVSTIPKELLKNANVIKRMEQMRFEIISTGETIMYQKYALTILNEAGNKYSHFSQYYDKLLSIRSIEDSLYDSDGKLLRKLKNKEIQDVSGVDDNNLFDDNRVKVHSFYYTAYPYTVEYETEVRFNHTF